MREFTIAVPVAAAVVALVGCAATSQASTSASERYGIGRSPTVEELRGWDIDVRADGVGLPPGSGTVALGRAVYQARCAACHGAEGAGNTAPALVGGVGTLATTRPKRTVGSFWPYTSTVFDYVKRSMPWDKPQSLDANEVYAVTAYLLHANKLIAESAVMDAQSLPAVQMPNRGGFIQARQQENIVKGTRCMTNC